MAGLIYAPTLSLPDGALINGVANFYRNTKPLTRVDGSALAVGDRWFNSATDVEGFWNGTYWLTQDIYEINWAITTTWGAAGTRTATINRTVRPEFVGLFFETYSVLYLNNAASPWNVNNFTSFTFNVTSIGASNVPMATTVVNDISNTNTAIWKYIPINFFRSLSGGDNLGTRGVRDITVTATKTGTGTNVQAIDYLTYRGVL